MSLSSERKSASFSSERMSELLFNGPQSLANKRSIEQIIDSDPLFDRDDRHFQSREQAYERGCQQAVRLWELTRKYQWNKADGSYAYTYVDARLPYGLHYAMFIPAIEAQGTREQRRKWLPLCYDLKIIGTYAQTELGHGSFIRGLETTAQFDEATDEFVLNTPTITAMKWWPGNLGKSSNYCVIMAQLITKGKNHGLHAFIVQLRSLQDHMPLPGVIVGDIGPKFGYLGNDNGFLILKNVRIPRDNMLMRYAKVDRQGNYSTPPHSKLAYATMVLMRTSIVVDSSIQLAKACTIAIRYSAVRRQFFSDSNPDQTSETKIIDYQTQQQKLFPLLAQAYMIHFTGIQMQTLYDKNVELVSKGNLSLMAEVHATSSCLKALFTALSCEGMENARKALGGHGYSRFSGIIDAYIDWLPSQTYEGENTILYLQTARYLVKAIGKAMKGEKISENTSVGYLSRDEMRWIKAKCTAKSENDFMKPATILDAFCIRAGSILAYVALQIQKIQTKGGKSASLAFENSSVDLCKAAWAHAWYVGMKCFHDALNNIKDPSLRVPLEHLFCLLGLSHLEEHGSELLESGYFSPDHMKMIRSSSRKTLALIRPNAVALVDSWDFTDKYLNSALGRYDGNVYEALYENAKKSPLNKSDIAPGVKEYLLPRFKSQL